MRPQVTAKEFYIDADVFSGDASAGNPLGLRASQVLGVSDIQRAPYADPAAPDVVDDEFNSDTLDAKWATRINNNAPLTIPTSGNSSVLLNVTRVNVNEVQGFTQPFTGGNGGLPFTLEARMNMSRVNSIANAYPAWGIGISDGTRYCFAALFADSGVTSFGVFHWSTYNSYLGESRVALPVPAMGPPRPITNGWPYQLDMWIRFRRSGNDAIAGVSFNGIDWAEQTYAGTLAAFGTINACGMMGQNTGAASAAVAPRYYYFRRVA
jgi:hypothetical protein